MNESKHQLLPHQEYLLNDQTTQLLAKVGGVGAGKTFFLSLWLILKAFKYPGENLWYCSDSYKLALNPGLETVVTVLKQVFGYTENVHFTANRSAGAPKIKLKALNTNIYFQSARAFRDWKGVSLAAAVGDEPGHWPDGAARELLERMRGSTGDAFVRQILYGGTPQGLTPYMKMFSGQEFKADGPAIELGGKQYQLGRVAPNKKVLHFPTFLNPHVGQNYVTQILENYGHDKALIRSHLFGEFCPLFEKNCFEFGDKNIIEHISLDTNRGPLKVSFDFNIGQMAWSASQHTKEDKLLVIREAEQGIVNTDAACQDFIEKFPPFQFKHHPIEVNGDATGRSGDTRGEYTDYDIISHELGKYYSNMTVNVPHVNPGVRVSILATNRALTPNKITKKPIQLLVSKDCPFTIDSMYNTVYTDDGAKIAKPAGDTVTHRSDTIRYKVWQLFPFEGMGSIKGVSW